MTPLHPPFGRLVMLAFPHKHKRTHSNLDLLNRMCFIRCCSVTSFHIFVATNSKRNKKYIIEMDRKKTQIKKKQMNLTKTLREKKTHTTKYIDEISK